MISAGILVRGVLTYFGLFMGVFRKKIDKVDCHEVCSWSRDDTIEDDLEKQHISGGCSHVAWAIGKVVAQYHLQFVVRHIFETVFGNFTHVSEKYTCWLYP